MKSYVLKRDYRSLPERLTRYKSELNEEQFRVVTAPPKAALVVAGAGTGKTRAITYRVAYLIEQGVSPQRILLATFTNRASREMLRRVETLTGSQNVHRVWGGTFHRIGNLILRRHAVSIGYDSNYSILDSEDARDFINACIEDAAIDTRAKRFPKADVVQDIISFANNTDKPIDEIVIEKYPYFEMLTQQIKRVDAIYTLRKKERNVMDYDDLLLNWKLLLLEKPEIANLYAEQFQHILVDEYQDTNKLQAEIIDLLAVKHRNVMVVGDDAQSIFAWRGAEFTNIYEFPERYPDAQVFKLETNYRSTPEILGNPSKRIALILEHVYEQYLQENYENAEIRAEDIRGLSLYAQRYDSTETFLSELALLSTERFKEPTPLVGEEVVSGGEDDELLTLTSVHQAKGLEWKTVFIIWAAEGKFPSPRSLREIDSEEEERRLWYVALTRAKDELHITYPLLMTDYSRQTVLQKPSRFVTECPPALFEIWNLDEEAIVPEQLPQPASSDEFIN